MNREMNNTLTALGASGTLLVAVLVLASPATPDAVQIVQGAVHLTGMEAAAMLADATKHAAPASDSDSDSISTDSTPTRFTGTSSRWHHSSLAMPYFSFAPRG